MLSAFIVSSDGCAPAEIDGIGELGQTATLELDAAANEPVPSDSDVTAPLKDPQTLREEAERALAAGDHQAASLAVRAASRQQPDDPATIFLMATILASQHRYHEAVRMLDQLAIQEPAASLPVLGQTAEWLVLQGDWDSAETRFRQVIQEVPEAAMAHRQLAQLLLRRGRRAEAASHLHQLCRLGDVRETELLTLLTISQPIPDNADAESAEPIGALGEAWSLVSHQQWKPAIDRLQPEVDSCTACNGLMGRIYVEMADEKSLSDWAAALDQQESTLPPEAQCAMGAHRLSTHEYEEAAQALTAAVAYDPSDSRAHSLLADALRAKEDESHNQSAMQAEWVQRSQALAMQLHTSVGDNNKAPLIADLVVTLESLRRPFESLAWQVLQTIYQSDLTDEAKQKQINEINERRLKLLRG